MKIFKRKTREHYYNITDIDSTGALYRLIIGKKSNGKTYAVCHNIVHEYIMTGKYSVYLRRYTEDVKPQNVSDLLRPHWGYISKMTHGAYNCTVYKKGAFLIAYRNPDTGDIDHYDEEHPILYTATLSGWEHRQGADRGECAFIFFDEFCSRLKYLPDEFITFGKVISTYMRDRPIKAVYMCSNTVNVYCPYWAEMGIYNVEKLKKGEIAHYSYNNGDTTIAVEYCADSDNTQQVNKYFAFDNPRLNMIFNGDWEIANYRHLSSRFTAEDIYLRFYVKFTGHYIAGDILKRDSEILLFFHPCKPPDVDNFTIFYTDEPIRSIYHSNSFNHCKTEKQRLILNLLLTNRDYYANNTIGEIITNFRKEAERIAI